MTNKVILSGRVGTDPKVEETSNGKAASFRFATTKRWRDKAGERQEKTTWHTIKAWGAKERDGLAGLVEKHVRKGSRLLIVGEINNTESGEGEARRYFSEVVADDIELLDARPEPSAERQAAG